MLVAPTLAAAREIGASVIALTGGVAANSRLRECLTAAAADEGFKVIAPSLKYCTDNAAMVGGIALAKLAAGQVAELDVDVTAGLVRPGRGA